MTRYSREKIAEMLAEANGHMNYIEYENIISQLLEEVRILREGLDEIKWEIENCDWGCLQCGYDLKIKDTDLYSALNETLTKADEVGKVEE